MRKLALFVALLTLLSLLLASCSSSTNKTEEKILNANFEIEEKNGKIKIIDKSKIDFKDVEYHWKLDFITVGDKLIYEEHFKGKDLSFPKPNTKRALLHLKLIAKGGESISKTKKEIPTEFCPVIPTVTEEKEELRVHFEKGADTWVLMDNKSNVIERKDFNKKKKTVFFDFSGLEGKTIFCRVMNGDWFLNQTKFTYP